MSEYVELFPGQHDRVLGYCRFRAVLPGGAWCNLDDIETAIGPAPAAGAVMALREQGKLQTRVRPTGRVEVAICGDAG